MHFAQAVLGCARCSERVPVCMVSSMMGSHRGDVACELVLARYPQVGSTARGSKPRGRRRAGTCLGNAKESSWAAAAVPSLSGARNRGSNEN